jgi:hypothetical protein
MSEEGESMRTRIYVHNLPTGITSKDVFALFAPMFDIRSLVLADGAASFEIDRHDAEMLELEFDRLHWRGRTLRVRVAE